MVSLEIRDVDGTTSVSRLIEDADGLTIYQLGSMLRRLLLSAGYHEDNVEDVISADVYNAL
jgi:hypothetical protein